MGRGKRPIAARHMRWYAGADRRQAGDAYSPDLYFIRAAFAVDDEPGTPRDVITETEARQLGLFLRALPSRVVADVTGGLTGADRRTLYEVLEAVLADDDFIDASSGGGMSATEAEAYRAELTAIQAKLRG
jgi:hypothetical protein